jgi:uncharacterized OB-fold protein
MGALMNTQVPAIDGWFTTTDAPALLGTRCGECGTSFFPPERTFCRNPGCTSTDLAEVELSRTGRVWSWSVDPYAAPAPYVGTEPFEPYTVVAVELAAEQMVVLGQLADGIDPGTLEVGVEMEITIEPLFTDADGNEHIVWKWRPLGGRP